ncbi:hypothetical protein C8Q73DRAFT_788843 [Cubamyces lactineus]|nr:hypothetical protein C8Q73DRAFT_788843 [Cubamyces lactineus]
MDTIILLDDIDLLAQWKESEWIRQKKTYPAAQTPSVVLAARRQVLAIPPDQKGMLPDPKTSVASFLQADLPSQPPRLVFEKAEKAFHHDPPTEDLQGMNFRMRPIPPKPFIEKLEQSFGQAWFDGASSVVDSRYKQSRLPLYVLTYWREMSRVLEKMARWHTASKWLDRYVQKHGHNDMTNKVHTILDNLAWGADLRAYGAATTTDTLAILLSEAWLDDELIDMLTTHLASRVRGRPDLEKCLAVVTLSFQHCILAYSGKRPDGPVPTVLLDIKERVNSGIQQLYFPANLENTHWVAFHVDFNARIIQYGDSQVAQPSKAKTGPVQRLVKAIQAWSRAELRIELQNLGNTLVHGLQKDSSSCGVTNVR